MTPLRSLAAFAAALLPVCVLRAQPTPAAPFPLAVGAGVDTTGRQHDPFVLWRDYLGDRPDSVRPNDAPDAAWSRDERARWPIVDLTSTWLYVGADWARGLSATLVELAPDTPGDTTAYVVRTLFSRVDGGVVRPVALVRVYAVRDGGRWALANALPRLTRDWPRVRAGHVEFAYGPGRRADTALAAHAGRFIDSAAAALGIAPPAAAYYLVASPREMARILGLEFALPPNTGRVYAEDGIVVAGSPGTTEWNTHDLAHVLLAPLVPSAAPRWWSEGAATWIGGRSGRDFPRLVRELAGDLAENPGRTLDSLVAPHAWRDSVSTTAAAVLVRLAFERGGAAAVRALATAPDASPTGVRRAAATALGVRPDQVEAVWRKAVARLAVRDSLSHESR
ncbi:MAG: hypothetical protein JO180_01925 [Gemmatirosa sp.]|nr:hypothetical protein [Gemmatirosa sp.]